MNRVSEELVLITPTVRLAGDFEALAREHVADGDTRYRDAATDPAAFVRQCEDQASGRNLPSAWVRQSTFWLVRDDARILGCARLRHQLTASLSHEGGHIGYDIRPSERGRGYGTVLLRLTLAKARELDLIEVLITANESNPASWAVIEKNGGRREDGLFAGTSGPFRRYWIRT